MKSEKGVTLTTLIIYLAVLMLATTIITTFISFFVSNMNQIRQQENYAPEFNKFNMFFLADIKSNKSALVTATQIEFEDGTVYIYNENQKEIYRNDVKIADKIEYMAFTSFQEKITVTTKQIINVKMTIKGRENAKNGIDYVLRYW